MSQAIKGRVLTVTPDLAQKWLERTTNDKARNRHVNQGRVEEYVATIKAGKWRCNGEAIILDADGYVLDGQHRLWAVFYAERPIEVMVVEGVDRDTFATIDTGANRTMANVLQIRGQAHAAVLGSALRWLALYRQKAMFSAGGVRTGGVKSRVTHERLLELLGKEPGIMESLALASVKGLAICGPLSAFVFCHYCFQAQNRDLAEDFFGRLGSGVGLEAGDPILALREKLLEAKATHAGVQTVDVIFVTFKAWWAIQDGVRIGKQQLAWRRQATERRPAEPFPYLDQPRPRWRVDDIRKRKGLTQPRARAVAGA